MRRVIYAVPALLLSIAASAFGQPPPPVQPPGVVMPRDARAEQKTGTARLAGRVLDAENGRPLRRAVVRIGSPELREGRSVSTDADGRWEIKDLPAGRYSVMISKGRFVALQYGQRRPFEQGRPVEVADGQTLNKLDVSLPRGSVITGRIVDEFGEPIAGVRVAAMRHRFMQGQRRLFPAGPMGTFDTTDDLGHYRLHGLAPGEYYVSATHSPGFTMEVSADRTGYAETYYPGTPSEAEAQRVAVALGQETTEINFPLASTRVASVSGMVVTSAGRPVANEMIMLAPANPGGMFGAMNMGRIRPDGTFTISNVKAGEYRLEVRVAGESGVMGPGGPVFAEVGSLPVTVGGRDISGVTVVTAPMATMTGRIVFDQGAPPDFLAGALTVAGTPADPGRAMFTGATARVRDDWTFETRGLTDRRIIRVMGAPPGWAVKSVTLNGNDVTDSGIEFKGAETVSGIEITLTQNMPGLSGSVHDDRNTPVTDYVVVAFASDSRKWGAQTRHVRSARPDQGGKFLLRSLPPDDYLLVALDYVEAGEESDPELLETLRRVATPVTLAEGETKNVTLKLSRQP